MTKPSSYAEVGVDRTAEEIGVNIILELIKKTHSFGHAKLPQGHYAGSIPFLDYYLSLATDGVGTKVLLAIELGILDTIGIDCVAMNTNDLIAMNSIPAAFVDYIAIKKPDKTILTEIMKGLVEGCIQSEIPLIGGETAILPELIAGNENEFDVAGTALGIQSKNKIITGEEMKNGDIILGIASSGIHSNGLTLARRLVDDEKLKRELLIPTRIYVKMIKELTEGMLFDEIVGMAHITGGGFTNLLRLGDFSYKITLPKLPRIFTHLKSQGNIADKEMYTTFNCGIGYLIVVKPGKYKEIKKLCEKYYPTSVLGNLHNGKEVVVNDILL